MLVPKEKYTIIAEQPMDANASSCCGATSSCCGEGMTYSIMADDYSGKEGYAAGYEEGRRGGSAAACS